MLTNFTDAFSAILERFERTGGLVGLVYGCIFLIMAYIISKFGEQDGLVGMIYSGTLLLIGYLVQQQSRTTTQLFDMLRKNDERLEDFKRSAYKTGLLYDRRKSDRED